MRPPESDQELKERYEMLTHIEEMIHNHIPSAKVFMFGSTANRLAFPGSDIDILIVENTYKFNDLYNGIH